MAATEPSQLSFDDLAFWRTSLPGVEHAILPPSSDQPNPRLGLGMLFASVFAPGVAYALDAATGDICWRCKLPYLGGHSIELAGDLLFAKTAQALYALDPRSGNIRWEFSPYGAEGETLYSAPTLDGKRLFIGDRLGWLYCLDVDTGETIWKRLTSDDANHDVNATAIVVAGLVITATNAGVALAYTVEDGRPVWQSKLDGPCTHHLFLAGKQVVAAAKSLHFLDPLTGELQDRVGRPGLEVGFAAGTPSQVALFWNEWEKYNQAEVNQRESEILFMFEGARLLREIHCSPYASAVRFSRATGLLYASGLSGLDILNPDTGEWLHTLRSTEMTGGYGLPDVAGNRIYTMDGTGVVCAVQHPGVWPQASSDNAEP
jgi:putative pyrroloquinoline-quinone binding quinoprotein